MSLLQPDHDCTLCPRLAAFRQENRSAFPDKFNAPVPSFGGQEARLLIVGLAPGLRGANFTGRPFTGDYAGDLLYQTLLDFGFAKGAYKADPQDGLELIDCRITNAVRCVPPENKPVGAEITACQPFLKNQIENMPNLKVILTLGLVAHNATLRASGHKQSAFKFTHNGAHDLGGGHIMIGSYHCSRYNTNTRRLTEEMFREVFQHIKSVL